MMKRLEYFPPFVRLTVMRDYLPIGRDAIYAAQWRGRKKAYPFIEKKNHRYFVNIRDFVEWSLARGVVPKLPDFIQAEQAKEAS